MAATRPAALPMEGAEVAHEIEIAHEPARKRRGALVIVDGESEGAQTPISDDAIHARRRRRTVPNVHLQPLLCDVGAIVCRVVDRVRQRCEVEQVALFTEIDEGCPRIMVDGARLGQAVQQLVGVLIEAFENRPSMEPSVIEIRTEGHSEHVAIVIGSNRPWIGAVEMETTVCWAGTIIQLHGGTLTASTEEGWTQFEMRLPLPPNHGRGAFVGKLGDDSSESSGGGSGGPLGFIFRTALVRGGRSNRALEIGHVWFPALEARASLAA